MNPPSSCVWSTAEPQLRKTWLQDVTSAFHAFPIYFSGNSLFSIANDHIFNIKPIKDPAWCNRLCHGCAFLGRFGRRSTWHRWPELRDSWQYWTSDHDAMGRPYQPWHWRFRMIQDDSGLKQIRISIPSCLVVWSAGLKEAGALSARSRASSFDAEIGRPSTAALFSKDNTVVAFDTCTFTDPNIGCKICKKQHRLEAAENPFGLTLVGRPLAVLPLRGFRVKAFSGAEEACAAAARWWLGTGRRSLVGWGVPAAFHFVPWPCLWGFLSIFLGASEADRRIVIHWVFLMLRFSTLIHLSWFWFILIHPVPS